MFKILIILFGLGASTMNAQFIEDGLRLMNTENGVSPRSNALGMSFYGINDDGAALYFNPAGMQLIPATEIQFGGSVKYLNSDINYLNSDFSNDRSAQSITNFTFVAPFEDNGSKFTIGFGYFNDRDFYDYNNFSIFNTQNSFISANSNNVFIQDLALANSNGVTPLNDSLLQNYSLKQDGNNSRFTGGISFSLNKLASIGLSISGLSGNYSYLKKIDEIDSEGKFNVNDDLTWSDVDFSSLYYTEIVSQEISGITGSIGVVVTPTEKSRVFLSMDLPNYYEITEQWRYDAESNFDNLDYVTVRNSGESKYSVRTPIKFNIGASYNIFGLTLTGGMSYMDVTNLNFESDDNFTEELNLIVPERLASAKIDWGVGAEYQFPMYPVFLRASYSSNNTPYRQGFIDLTTMKTLAVGAGFLVGKNFMLDVSLSNRDYEETIFVYSNQSYLNVRDITNVIVGISYRF